MDAADYAKDIETTEKRMLEGTAQDPVDDAHVTQVLNTLSQNPALLNQVIAEMDNLKKQDPTLPDFGTVYDRRTQEPVALMFHASKDDPQGNPHKLGEYALNEEGKRFFEHFNGMDKPIGHTTPA
jgi:hypothetical protein